MSDDPYSDRLQAKANYHHERARYWRAHSQHRFDNANQHEVVEDETE
jgi:hypothetical protein